MEDKPMIHIDISEEAAASLNRMNIGFAALIGYGAYLFGKRLVKKTYLSTTATISDGYMVVEKKYQVPNN